MIAAVGLTSRHLVIPISEHQDTVGPITRTVKDAAHILQVIAGRDSRDNYTSAIPSSIIPDYVSACKLSGLSGVRFGIPRNVLDLFFKDNATVSMLAAFQKSLYVLQSAGATIVENMNFTAAEEFWDSDIPGVILNADFLVNLKVYLDTLTHNPNKITSLAALRNFTKSSPLEDYPTRDIKEWDQALGNWNNTDARFWPAYQQNLHYGGDGGLLGALDRYNLDAVVLPTNFACGWAATVGAPIITVPMGSYPAGLPVVKNSWGLVESAPNIP